MINDVIIKSYDDLIGQKATEHINNVFVNYNTSYLHNKTMLDNFYANLLLNKFVWNGLDALDIEQYYIEYSLLYNAPIALVQYNNNYYILPCQILKTNIYMQPLEIRCLIPDNLMFESDIFTDFVICFDNLSRTTLLPTYAVLLDTLARVTTDLEILLSKCKNNTVIITNEANLEQQYNMLEQLLQYNVIYAKDISDIKTIDLSINTSYVDRLFDYKKYLHNQIDTLCNVSSNDVIKKERLITAEVSNINSINNVMINSEYKARKQFCEKVNQKTGLNINVEVSIYE